MSGEAAIKGAPIEGILVVHFDEDGEIAYHVFGDERVRLFIVDDRAPNDRVYEYLSRAPMERFRELVPEGIEIGNCRDARHTAVKRRILADEAGDRHLTLVQPVTP